MTFRIDLEIARRPARRMFEDDSDHDRRKQSLLSLRTSATGPAEARAAARSFRQSPRPTRTIPRRATGWRDRGAKRRPARCLRHSPRRRASAPSRSPSRREPKQSRWSWRNLLSPKVQLAKPDETVEQTDKPGWFSRKRADVAPVVAQPEPEPAPSEAARRDGGGTGGRQLVRPAKSRACDGVRRA